MKNLLALAIAVIGILTCSLFVHAGNHKKGIDFKDIRTDKVTNWAVKTQPDRGWFVEMNLARGWFVEMNAPVQGKSEADYLRKVAKEISG